MKCFGLFFLLLSFNFISFNAEAADPLEERVDQIDREIQYLETGAVDRLNLRMGLLRSRLPANLAVRLETINRPHILAPDSDGISSNYRLNSTLRSNEVNAFRKAFRIARTNYLMLTIDIEKQPENLHNWTGLNLLEYWANYQKARADFDRWYGSSNSFSFFPDQSFVDRIVSFGRPNRQDSIEYANLLADDAQRKIRIVALKAERALFGEGLKNVKHYDHTGNAAVSCQMALKLISMNRWL